MEYLEIRIPKNDSLLWCKRLYWMEKGCRDAGAKESADVMRELYDLFFRASMEQLSPDEVERFAACDRIDTFAEFIDTE